MNHDNTKASDRHCFGMGKGLALSLNMNVNMHLVLVGPDGKIKDERFVHNTVTTAGKNGVADQLLAAPSVAKPGWMAIGTGTPTSTLLGAEVARVALTSKTRGANSIITMVGDFGAGVGTSTITEAGTFNVVTANTVDMYTSASFGAITKGASDSLSISWTITIS